VSHANVELTYRAIEAFNRRDLDAYLAVMDPEGWSSSRNASSRRSCLREFGEHFLRCPLP
jgi:hypothetical protein